MANLNGIIEPIYFLITSFGLFFLSYIQLRQTGKSIAIGETKIFSGDSKDLICHSTSIYPVDSFKT